MRTTIKNSPHESESPVKKVLLPPPLSYCQTEDTDDKIFPALHCVRMDMYAGVAVAMRHGCKMDRRRLPAQSKLLQGRRNRNPTKTKPDPKEGLRV